MCSSVGHTQDTPQTPLLFLPSLALPPSLSPSLSCSLSRSCSLILCSLRSRGVQQFHSHKFVHRLVSRSERSPRLLRQRRLLQAQCVSTSLTITTRIDIDIKRGLKIVAVYTRKNMHTLSLPLPLTLSLSHSLIASYEHSNA